jgi:hypothetical protein
MSGDEFREKGYLQEVNRRFFHPLGIALAAITNNATGEIIGFQIVDDRDDSYGTIYDLKNSDVERIKRFQKNETFINEEIKKRSVERLNMLGHVIEPIPGLK